MQIIIYIIGHPREVVILMGVALSLAGVVGAGVYSVMGEREQRKTLQEYDLKNR